MTARRVVFAAFVSCAVLLVMEWAAGTFFPDRLAPSGLFAGSAGDLPAPGPLRGSEMTPKGAAFRVLMMGDSMVYGSGVSTGETLPAQLQKKLEAKLNRPVEVLNAGVGGFSTYDELVKFKSIGPELRPDFVIVGVFLRNRLEYDGANDLSSNHFRLLNKVPQKETAAEYLRRHSSLYGLADHVVRRLREIAFGPEAVREEKDPRKIAAAWAETGRLLDVFAAEAGKLRARFLVFYIPYHQSVSDGDESALARFAATGHPAVSPLRKLRALCAGTMENCLVDDLHWNAVAYAAMADELAAALAAEL